jgi:hypothetical protein
MFTVLTLTPSSFYAFWKTATYLELGRRGTAQELENIEKVGIQF